MTKLNMTVKQAAAHILRCDMEKVTDYWTECWTHEDDYQEFDQETIKEINAAMDKIMKPFMERLSNICPANPQDETKFKWLIAKSK